MRPTENIKRLIENAKVKINPEVKRVALGELVNELEKTNKMPSAETSPNIWRIIMKNRIAKFATAPLVTLIIVGALYFGFIGGTTTATEKLQEVIEFNANYKGWLHTTMRTREAAKDSPLSDKGILHMNTVDGTMIRECQQGNERVIQYYSPPKEEYIEYSSLKGEVAIYDLDSFPAKSLVESYPLTIDTIITLFKETTGKEPYQISIGKDNDYVRFDIISFENEEEAIRIGKEVGAVFPRRATIWVDADTHLICKAEDEDMDMLATYEYGEPFIEDIYDLGVPPDTMVRDYRKNLNTEAVLNRLEKRIAGLNHYVAIMTETPVNDDGKYNKNMCAIHVFAQHNDAWLANRYLVGVDSYGNGKRRAAIMETPENWPSVEIMSMLEKIKGKHPSEFFIYDEENLWSQYPVMPKSESAKDKKRTIDHIKTQFGLVDKIWLGNRRHHGPGTKIELISRDDEPNQIGLRIEFDSYAEPSVKQRHEEYYWFDSERDDMPTERISRDYSPGSQAIENEFHTVYLGYSKLLDGRWYPSKWRVTSVSNFQDGTSHKSTREYHLYINDDMELEKDWFANPPEKPND